MEIVTKTRLSRTLFDAKQCQSSYGLPTAKKISQRLGELKSVENLGVVLRFPGRKFHRLDGDRKGQIAAVLNGKRMIMRPAGDSKEYMENNTIVWDKVTRVEITDIENYHH